MKSVVFTIFTAFALLTVFQSPCGSAVNPSAPHDSANGYTCASCHTQHNTLGSAGYNNICLSCHRPGDPKAGVKPFSPADAADPFGQYAAPGMEVRYQTSHRWDGPDTNPAAGALPPVQVAMTSNGLRQRTDGKLACVRCHNQHSQDSKPFLRMANDRDQLCFDCHRSRDQRNHASGTHPVNVTYSGVSSKVTAKPLEYYSSPRNANPANPTSALRLNGGFIRCSTCHGVHYADSNSATLDTYSSSGSLKPSSGNLLRTDLRGATADAVNICTNCHRAKTSHNARGQNVQCADCHGAHVDTGDGSQPNVWLVNRQMRFSSAIRSAKNKPVLFQSATSKNYKDANGTGVCQSCHDIPMTAGYQTFHGAADSTTCNGCHFHTSALGSFSVDPDQSCSSCHGHPPAANAPGAGGYAAGYQASPSFSDESQSGHITHAGGLYHKECQSCHTGNNHLDGNFQDVFRVTAGTVAATGGGTPVYNASAQTCSTVYCHSNALPRGGAAIMATTPAWSKEKGGGRGAIVGQPGECGFCHSRAGDSNPSWSVSHTRHVNGYSTNTNFTCAACHAGTAANNTSLSNPDLHADGVKNVVFGGIASGGIWDAASATCSALYCHGSVQGAAGLGTPVNATNVKWNDPPMTCGSCHAAMIRLGNVSSATGSHKRHVQTYSFSCGICHGSGYSSTTVNVGTHVNNTITMSFTGTAALNGATPGYYQTINTPGNGYDRCNTVYCHSTVQAAGGVGAPAFASPVWGSAPLICGSCHANMATSTAGSGSHPLHALASTGGYSCVTCHNGAGKDPNPPFAATAKHADGSIDISFSGSAAGTIYSRGASHVAGSGAYGNCTNSSCHGAGTPTWGADTNKPECEKCHGSATTTPFATTNGATSTTDPRAGAHTAHLQASHVLSGKVACAECHTVPATINSAGHLDSALPAEVALGGILAKTGGVRPVYNPATRSCATTYCHGGSPLTIGGTTTAPVWNVPLMNGTPGHDCALCHGYPPATTVHSGKTPTDCVGCHVHVKADGTGFTDSTKHIDGTIQANGHVIPYYTHNTVADFSSCIGCHTDGSSTAYPAVVAGTPPDCRGCHAVADPVITKTGCTSCHAKPPNGAASPNSAGSHAKHSILSALPDNCTYCHAGAGSGSGANHGPHLKVSGTVNVVFASAQAGLFAQWSTSRNSCSSISCHGQGHPVWGSGAIFSAVDTCSNCHGSAATNPFYSTSIPKNTSKTDAKTGAHTAHLFGTANISNAIACLECHVVPASVESAGHMDGNTQLVFNGALAKAQSTNATSCGTTWCHGGNTTLLPQNNPARTAPVWGTPFPGTSVPGTGGPSGTSGSGYCAQCHGYPPLSIVHTGKSATECAVCHTHVNASGTGFTNPSLHVNGIIEAKGHVFPYPGSAHLSAAGTTPWSVCTSCHTNSAGGTYPVAAGTAPDCTGCHVQNLRAPVGTSSCWDCHGASATDGLPNGTTFPNNNRSHSAHVSIAGTACTICHTGGGNGTATHGSSNRTGATQASVKIAFSAQAGPSAAWTPATITCSTTYCHGQGAPVWGTPLWSTTDQCGKCHSSTAVGAVTAGTPFYSTSYPAKVTASTDAKAGAHMSHIMITDSLSNALNCSDCHGIVTLTGATHMNGATTFAWSTLATKNGALTPAYSAAAGQCFNVYCHGASMPGGDTTGSNRAPTWNVAFLSATLSRAACASCHGFPPAAASGHPVVTLPASWPAVGAATGALGTTCSCHANISTTGTTYANIFVNKALHIDGTLQVTGGHAFPYPGSAHLSAAGTPPWSACTSCHTNSAGGTYPVAAGSAPNCTGCHVQNLRAPVGTSSCWDCHGASATDGLPNGTTFPNNNRSHSAHVSIAGTACTICHTGGGNGTATHGSSNRTGATQASVKIAFSAQAGPSAAWTPATITCSTTYCHGQGAPVWGTPLWSTADQCGKCHSSTAAGAVTAGTPFYSTSYPAKVTASTDAKAGAHTSHITSTDSLTAALNCSDCHGTVTLTGATHMNGNTSFTWSTLATKNGALTPAYSVATGQCSNVYCHGASMPGGDTTGSNRTPTWNVAFLSATLSRAACASCHGFPPAAASGHPAVTLPASWPAVGAATGALGTTCSCHANISTTGTTYANIFVNKALHIDGTLQVTGGHAFPYPGSAHLSAAGTNPWSACTSCHTNSAGGTYPVAAGSAPNCTGCHVQSLRAPVGTSSCWDCHGASATDGLPNGTTFPNNNRSHSAHVSIAGTACTICHTGGGNGTATHGSSNRTGATQASVKIAFSAQAGPSAAWTPATITCSTTYCHGQGAPVWGTPLWSTTDQCGKCHSSTAVGAVTAGTPFYSTSYPAKVTASTDAKAGAHTSHITSTDSLTAALNCSDCHGTVTLTGATHMNGATTFAWSTLATKNGALTPAYSAATGQCSNVYCHGASMPGGDTTGSNRTPTWNVAFLSATLSRAACASCHGFPPAAASGHPAVTLPASWPAVGAATGALGTTCSCHVNISTTGTTYANIFVNKALHIDGTLQVSGGHAVPYDTHKADVVAAGGNTACLGCHAMGTAASPYPAAVIGNPPDCMSCHQKAAPVHTGTVAGANCSSCHGLSTATTTKIGRPVGAAYPDRLGFHSGASDSAHGTAACTVCHSGAGTTSGNNSGINHGKGSTAGPVRNGKPNVVGPMVNGITPTNSAKGVGIPANGSTCVHGTISAGCSGGGTKTNRW